MPDSLERAFAPVLAEGADGRVVLDPWAPGALDALGARRPDNVLVIGSGLTGVDVALHLTARGATVTLLSRHGALPRRFRATGAPAELASSRRAGCRRCLAGAVARGAGRRPRARSRRRRGLAAGDRRGAAAYRPAVAVVGVGGPAPVPARRSAGLGGAAAPDATHDRRRDLRGHRRWSTRHRSGRGRRCVVAPQGRRVGGDHQRRIGASPRRRGRRRCRRGLGPAVAAPLTAVGRSAGRRHRVAAPVRCRCASHARRPPDRRRGRYGAEHRLYRLDPSGRGMGNHRDPRNPFPGSGYRDTARRRHPRPADQGAQPHHDDAGIVRRRSVVRRRCASPAGRPGRRLDGFRGRGRRGS